MDFYNTSVIFFSSFFDDFFRPVALACRASVRGVVRVGFKEAERDFQALFQGPLAVCLTSVHGRLGVSFGILFSAVSGRLRDDFRDGFRIGRAGTLRRAALSFLSRLASPLVDLWATFFRSVFTVLSNPFEPFRVFSSPLRLPLKGQIPTRPRTPFRPRPILPRTLPARRPSRFPFPIVNPVRSPFEVSRDERRRVALTRSDVSRPARFLRTTTPSFRRAAHSRIAAADRVGGREKDGWQNRDTRDDPQADAPRSLETVVFSREFTLLSKEYLLQDFVPSTGSWNASRRTRSDFEVSRNASVPSPFDAVRRLRGRGTRGAFPELFVRVFPRSHPPERLRAIRHRDSSPDVPSKPSDDMLRPFFRPVSRPLFSMARDPIGVFFGKHGPTVGARSANRISSGIRVDIRRCFSPLLQDPRRGLKSPPHASFLI